MPDATPAPEPTEEQQIAAYEWLRDNAPTTMIPSKFTPGACSCASCKCIVGLAGWLSRREREAVERAKLEQWQKDYDAICGKGLSGQVSLSVASIRLGGTRPPEAPK